MSEQADLVETDADVVFTIPDGIPAPIKAVEMVPEWFKKLSATTNLRPGDELDSMGQKPVSTVAMCRPFVDALKLGVTIPAPFSMSIDRTGDKIEVTVPDEWEDYVTTYDPPDSVDGGNSTFKLPELEVTLPLTLETDPGYVSLLTEPLNKGSDSLRPFSLAVDAGETAQTLTALLTFDGESIDVDAGEPLLDAVFLPRTSLLSTYTVQNFDDDHDRRDQYREFRELKEARGNDFYRLKYWEQKPVPEITHKASSRQAPVAEPATTVDAEDGVLHLDSMMESNEVDGETDVIFSVRDEWYDVIPEPTAASDWIPEQYRELESFLAGERSSTLQSWVLDAMRIGLVGRMTADIEFWFEGRGEDGLQTRTQFPDQILYNMSEELIRSNPSGEVTLVNWDSQWVCSTPDGYSALFTEPLNHFQSRMRAYSGIVENDTYLSTANTPSKVVGENDRVQLQKGEPMFQYIPVKRDELGVSVCVETVDSPV